MQPSPPVIRVRATRYIDPGALGSLSGALRLWQVICNDQADEAAFSVHFSFVCRGKARAQRVAASLRRRLACAQTAVRASGCPRSTRWHVHGNTDGVLQSLASLEQVSNWLRRVEESHQVALIRLSVIAPAA